MVTLTAAQLTSAATWRWRPILHVCGTYLNKYGRLAKGTVVTTVMSNFGLFKVYLTIAGLSTRNQRRR